MTRKACKRRLQPLPLLPRWRGDSWRGGKGWSLRLRFFLLVEDRRSPKQSQPANTSSFDFSKQLMSIPTMKVAVLFGGNSSERDVSIASGAQVAKALRQMGHQVLAVDTFRGILTDQEQASLLARGVAPAPPDDRDLRVIRAKTGSIVQPSYFVDADVVFLALHGGTGEDGTIQSVFDAAGTCYTGSNHVGSAAAMDKDLAKRLLVAAKVPTPPWFMAPVDPETAIRDLGLPLVVKPNKQGSTVGLTVVKRAGDLEAAIVEAYRHDDEVMLERFVPGREFTVGILGSVRLRSVKLFRSARRYSTTKANTRRAAPRKFFRRLFQ